MCGNADIELIESILLIQVDNVLASGGPVVMCWNLLRVARNLNLKLGFLPVRIEGLGRTEYKLMVSGDLDFETSSLTVLRLWLLGSLLWLGRYDSEASSFVYKARAT